MGDVKEFAKDKILETVQASVEPWMTFDEIQRISGVVNPAFITECLADFVSHQVIEERDADGAKEYKAVIKDDE